MPDLPVVEWTSSLELALRVTLRLFVAAALAALLGFEREAKGRSAGLRTYILVAMGSALFTLVPIIHGNGDPNLEEIVKGVAAGVGFLGAGAILKRESGGSVEGLTTAAGIWLTAAMGIAVGAGLYLSAVIATVFAFVTLSLLSLVEKKG